MKNTILNSTPEGTCSGDVVGGHCGRGNPSGAFNFQRAKREGGDLDADGNTGRKNLENGLPEASQEGEGVRDIRENTGPIG